VTSATPDQPERATITGGPLDGPVQRAKALADPTRARLLEILDASDTPVLVADLATSLGVHSTAIRQHLTKLIDAGLVTAERLDPTGRGRPRHGYRTVPARVAPYRTLAEVLAEAVRNGRSAREQGHLVGARAAVTDGDGIAALVDEAARWGFEPKVRSRRNGTTDIVLQSCPFASLAASDPATICELHLGLAEGVVSNHHDITVESLHTADPHRGECRFTVRTA
jgi:predicted ArsR family transcriptional regulator